MHCVATWKIINLEKEGINRRNVEV